MTQPNKPRFIAGAVCPQCGVEDRMVVLPDGGERRCINCDFSESRPQAGLTELSTRVSRAAARRVETQAEPIRLLEDSDNS